MNYPERLKQHIYSFIFYLLMYMLGINLGTFILGIFGKKSEHFSQFYSLLFPADIQSAFIAIIMVILWCALRAFISPFVRNFLVKHGYLNK